MPQNKLSKERRFRPYVPVNQRHRRSQHQNYYSSASYRIRSQQPSDFRLEQIRDITASLVEQLRFISELLYIENEELPQEESNRHPYEFALNQLMSCNNIIRAIRLVIRNQVATRQTSVSYSTNGSNMTYPSNPIGFITNHNAPQPPKYYANNSHY